MCMYIYIYRERERSCIHTHTLYTPLGPPQRLLRGCPGADGGQLRQAIRCLARAGIYIYTYV